MKLVSLATTATFETPRGLLVLKVGVGSAGVYRQWIGRKCRSAKKDTVNLSIECSGPKDWVLKMWNERYAK